MFHIRGAVLEQIGLPHPYARSRPIRVVDLDLEGPGRGEDPRPHRGGRRVPSDLSAVDGNRVRPAPTLLGHEDHLANGTAVRQLIRFDTP